MFFKELRIQRLFIPLLSIVMSCMLLIPTQNIMFSEYVSFLLLPFYMGGLLSSGFIVFEVLDINFLLTSKRSFLKTTMVRYLSVWTVYLVGFVITVLFSLINQKNFLFEFRTIVFWIVIIDYIIGSFVLSFLSWLATLFSRSTRIGVLSAGFAFIWVIFYNSLLVNNVLPQKAPYLYFDLLVVSLAKIDNWKKLLLPEWVWNRVLMLSVSILFALAIFVISKRRKDLSK